MISSYATSVCIELCNLSNVSLATYSAVLNGNVLSNRCMVCLLLLLVLERPELGEAKGK